MARAKIRTPSIDLSENDKAVLISLAKGEQLQYSFTLGFLSDLTGYTITAKVVEGNNLSGDLDVVPSAEEQATKVITNLDIIDDDVSDNEFKVVIPHDLVDTWDTQPNIDDPVYGFFAISIADTGVGSAQQIFVPLRGLIEIVYNPLESVA